MNSYINKRMFLGMLTGVLASSPAFSQNATGGQEAARNIISQQLDAFLADDFQAAYDFAAPNIHQLFPTVERFRNMVTNGYHPVHRSGSRSFGRSKALDGDNLLQEVFLTDAAGKGWKAVYRMRRQPDGSWKIAGVSLEASELPTI